MSVVTIQTSFLPSSPRQRNRRLHERSRLQSTIDTLPTVQLFVIVTVIFRLWLLTRRHSRRRGCCHEQPHGCQTQPASLHDQWIYRVGLPQASKLMHASSNQHAQASTLKQASLRIDGSQFPIFHPWKKVMPRSGRKCCSVLLA